MPPTILVVEDDHDIRELLILALTEAGFGVVEAESAAQAVLRFKEAPRIDLVLTDFNLPDGRNLIPTLKNLRPSLPVIVLSGNPGGARAALPEADAILGKPLSGGRIIEEIRRFVPAV